MFHSITCADAPIAFVSGLQFHRQLWNCLDQHDPLRPVQEQERIGKRPPVRSRIDYETIFAAWQVPQVAEGAAKGLVKKRPDFLGKATHLPYIPRPPVPLKCLATYGDRQMLGP